MVKNNTYRRSPWEDRFNRPNVEELRSQLKVQPQKLFSESRRRLLEVDGVREEPVWYGHCWRWSLEYRKPRSQRPLAVLVPSPTDLQLAMPLDREFLDSVSTRRMKRAVKDGLELAQEPFDTSWGVWSLGSMGMLDDLQDLLEQRLKHLARRAV